MYSTTLYYNDHDEFHDHVVNCKSLKVAYLIFKKILTVFGDMLVLTKLRPPMHIIDVRYYY